MAGSRFDFGYLTPDALATPMEEGGLGLLDENWWPVTGGDLPAGVMLLVRFGTSADGRFTITGLIVGGSTERRDDGGVVFHTESRIEVTTGLLREIRLSEILEDWDRLARFRRHPARKLFKAVKRDAVRIPAVRRRPGPRGHPPEHYRDVADAWRAAKQRSPNRPMQEFLEANPHLRVSEAQVYRWLQRARQLSYLEPTRASAAGKAKAIPRARARKRSRKAVKSTTKGKRR